MHSTKISGLAVDTEYTFHLVLRTTAGTYSSERVVVRTHKMTDLSGITITTGILPASMRESLASAVERIGAKMVDSVRIDTTHFVTTEGRGIQWEKAVEMNIPVVRPEWVEACETNGRILGVTKFYLDAVRPGPNDDRPAMVNPPQPQEQKDLPPPPAENGEASVQQEAKTPPAEDAAQKKEEAVEGDDDSEEESDEEQEEKTQSASQGEQKMRVEDREEQKVALRPGLSPSKSATVEDEEGEGSPDHKAAASPGDGNSFQDVAL